MSSNIVAKVPALSQVARKNFLIFPQIELFRRKFPRQPATKLFLKKFSATNQASPKTQKQKYWQSWRSTKKPCRISDEVSEIFLRSRLSAVNLPRNKKLFYVLLRDTEKLAEYLSFVKLQKYIRKKLSAAKILLPNLKSSGLLSKFLKISPQKSESQWIIRTPKPAQKKSSPQVLCRKVVRLLLLPPVQKTTEILFRESNSQTNSPSPAKKAISKFYICRKWNLHFSLAHLFFRRVRGQPSQLFRILAS